MSGETMSAANFGLEEYYSQSIPPNLLASNEPPPDVPPEPDVQPDPDTEEVPVVEEPEKAPA